MTDRELAIEEATHSQTGDSNATHFRVVVLHRWQHLMGTKENIRSNHTIIVKIFRYRYRYPYVRGSRGAYSKLYLYVLN